MFKKLIRSIEMLNQVLENVEEHLSASSGDKVKISASKSLSGGCINNAMKLETNLGEFFMKWNQTGRRDIFIREAESLREMAKASNGVLKIPAVYCVKEVGTSPGYLVLEYLRPKNVAVYNDDEKLGRGLALIHKYSNENFGFLNNNYCGTTEQNNKWTKDWSNFFADNRLGFLLELIQSERPLALSELKLFEKLQRKVPDLISKESSPVLIHGDLWSGNYMYTEHGPALIDPAAYYADREMEFAIITMFGGFSSGFYDAYNEVNPLAPDWKNRNKLYQLYHVLNHYLLFGGAYKNQAMQTARYYV